MYLVPTVDLVNVGNRESCQRLRAPRQHACRMAGAADQAQLHDIWQASAPKYRRWAGRDPELAPPDWYADRQARYAQWAHLELPAAGSGQAEAQASTQSESQRVALSSLASAPRGIECGAVAQSSEPAGAKSALAEAPQRRGGQRASSSPRGHRVSSSSGSQRAVSTGRQRTGRRPIGDSGAAELGIAELKEELANTQRRREKAEQQVKDAAVQASSLGHTAGGMEQHVPREQRNMAQAVARGTEHRPPARVAKLSAGESGEPTAAELYSRYLQKSSAAGRRPRIDKLREDNMSATDLHEQWLHGRQATDHGDADRKAYEQLKGGLLSRGAPRKQLDACKSMSELRQLGLNSGLLVAKRSLAAAPVRKEEHENAECGNGGITGDNAAQQNPTASGAELHAQYLAGSTRAVDGTDRANSREEHQQISGMMQRKHLEDSPPAVAEPCDIEERNGKIDDDESEAQVEPAEAHRPTVSGAELYQQYERMQRKHLEDSPSIAAAAAAAVQPCDIEERNGEIDDDESEAQVEPAEAHRPTVSGAELYQQYERMQRKHLEDSPSIAAAAAAVQPCDIEERDGEIDDDESEAQVEPAEAHRPTVSGAELYQHYLKSNAAAASKLPRRKSQEIMLNASCDEPASASSNLPANTPAVSAQALGRPRDDELGPAEFSRVAEPEVTPLSGAKLYEEYLLKTSSTGQSRDSSSALLDKDAVDRRPSQQSLHGNVSTKEPALSSGDKTIAHDTVKRYRNYAQSAYDAGSSMAAIGNDEEIVDCEQAKTGLPETRVETQHAVAPEPSPLGLFSPSNFGETEHAAVPEPSPLTGDSWSDSRLLYWKLRAIKEEKAIKLRAINEEARSIRSKTMATNVSDSRLLCSRSIEQDATACEWDSIEVHWHWFGDSHAIGVETHETHSYSYATYTSSGAVCQF